jgi:hypothetical protein
MRRKIFLPMLVLAIAAVVPACDFAKVGARCSASQGAARNNTHVLFCVKGKWKATVTIGQAAEIVMSSWPGSVTGGPAEVRATSGGAFPGMTFFVKTRGGQPAANVDVKLTATSGPGFSGTSFTVRTNGAGAVNTTPGQSGMPNVTMGSGVGDVKVDINAGPLPTPIGSFVIKVSGGAPSVVAAVSGRDQQITAGGTFQPWVFEVRDSKGAPTIPSTVKVNSGGLSGVSYTQSGATITVTAPPQYVAANQQSLTVEVSGAEPFKMTTFATGYTNWTIVAGAPDDADIYGDDQSAPVNTRFANSLVVDVIDAYGNSVTGLPITYTSIDGGSGASGTTMPNFYFNPISAVFVDANGTAGAWTVRADIPGLGTYDFSLTNTP